MNYQQTSVLRNIRLTALVGIVTLHGITGCGDAGDALPGTTATSVKRDASVKRDTASVTGGAGGGVIAVGSGGSGGGGGIGGSTEVVLGTGGSTTSAPDASPRDASPDLSADAVRVDVGVGAEAAVPLDSSVDTRDATTTGQDISQPDAIAVDLRDATVDTRDVAPDLVIADAPEAGDVTSDLPSDVPSDLPSDLPSPDTADAPNADTADVAAGPACSNPGWAKQVQYGKGWLAGDKEGTPFVANLFYNTLDLGGTAGTVTSAGDSDAVVVRLDPATGGAVWAKSFGDPASQDASGVAIDKSGHVGFIGKFQGRMAIGGGDPLSNLGAWPAAFVGALQATDGAGLWGLQANLSAGEGSAGALAAIAANPNFDDFIVCGKANVAVTELAASAVAGGGFDIVVAKIKGSDGSILWARQIGGAGEQLCAAAAIDDSGDAIIAGTFNGELDFGNGALSPAPAANSTIPWIAKLSGSNGSTTAAISAVLGTTGRTISFVFGLDTDPSGNIAMAGSFLGALTFGSISPITSAGLQDAYVAKFTHSLAPAWAKHWGDAKQQAARSVAFDSAGNLTVVGPFLGTINIGAAGATLTALTDAANSNPDIFLARLSGATGDSLCALSYGDVGGQEANNVFVSRFAEGAAKDVTIASGVLIRDSVLNFGSVLLDATGSSEPNVFWVARF